MNVSGFRCMDHCVFDRFRVSLKHRVSQNGRGKTKRQNGGGCGCQINFDMFIYYAPNTMAPESRKFNQRRGLGLATGPFAKGSNLCPL